MRYSATSPFRHAASESAEHGGSQRCSGEQWIMDAGAGGYVLTARQPRGAVQWSDVAGGSADQMTTQTLVIHIAPSSQSLPCLTASVPSARQPQSMTLMPESKGDVFDAFVGVGIHVGIEWPVRGIDSGADRSRILKSSLPSSSIISAWPSSHPSFSRHLLVRRYTFALSTLLTPAHYRDSTGFASPVS
ncbi:hypothetical protein MVEN_02310400 [Mycena venus]|uniref:Uncharacterized protein n=1 Tax=Mycena venus TaxID=2733690 RepID=A0A8H7CFY6_9AGAR|nr:hypothetical protein MVEN_02310400 [Mycena venus]